MSVKSMMEKDLYEFGPFRLDLRARLLSRDGETIPLAPKSFDVLTYLVRNAGRAVSREELLSGVWPDVVVSDGTLTQAVFVIRRALGETDESSRLLATVPRMGYRFTDEVQAFSPAAELSTPLSDRARSRPRIGRPLAVLAAAIALTLAAIALAPRYWVFTRQRSPSSEASLLSMVLEIAVPPDAATLLGCSGTTAVLGSPSAVYLVSLDGALAPTRVSLADGEVVADRLVGGDLVVASGPHLVARDAVTQASRPLGTLPGGLEPREGGLFVSPDGRFVAVRGPDAIRVFSFRDGNVTLVLRTAPPDGENGTLVLSREWLAVAPGGGAPVVAWRLMTGEKAFEAPFPETRVSALALDDLTGTLAAGGAFDTVAVFPLAGGGARKLQGHGWTRGLAFVPDYPTLVASGRLGVGAFRADAVASLASPLNGGPVAVTPHGVLVLCPERQRLALLAYAGFPPVARIPLSGAPLWTVEHDSDGRTLFAGGRDGVLYVVDQARRQVRRETVHTDGIPSLLRAGSLLASTSDDKTVAVWSLPGPKLVMRTPAHGFLVNDLAIAPTAPGGPRLLTASSDGTLKTWRWPSLEPIETVDLGPLVGEKVEAHALWTSPDGSRVLVGTWNHALLDLTLDGGEWRGRKVATASTATYRFASLPRLGLVAGVGLYPHEVFVVDLTTGERQVLDSASLDAFWAVAPPESDALFVVGLGGVLRYDFTRAADGGLVVALHSRRQSGLLLQCVTRLPDGTLWAGTADGALVSLDAAGLDGAALSLPRLHFARLK